MAQLHRARTDAAVNHVALSSGRRTRLREKLHSVLSAKLRAEATDDLYQLGFDLGADEHTGVDLSPSWKSASPEEAGAGDVVTFTIALLNSGDWNAPDTVLFDAIPGPTTYVSGRAQATSGMVTDTGGIGWTGTVSPNLAVTITFQVTADEAVGIVNTAVLTDVYGTVLDLVAWVNAQHLYVPLVLRSF